MAKTAARLAVAAGPLYELAGQLFVRTYFRYEHNSRSQAVNAYDQPWNQPKPGPKL